jgi:serine/threonine protein kinase
MSDPAARLSAALEGRYRFEREIGAGGMATVYLAHDERYDRYVAVKVLKPDIAAAVGTDRFLREIRITAQLNHPHILPLLDSGAVSRGIEGSVDRVIATAEERRSNDPAIQRSFELLYYVMPYVAGGSLRQRMRAEGFLALPAVLRIAEQVAAALDHAHRSGIVHRDVKPENILFSEGLAVVSDFGIAKAVAAASGGGVTRSGFPLGTPGYMSPEQAAGRAALDARTDVFGLGCVVYEMLIGDTPEMWPTEEGTKLGRFTDASPEHRARLDRLPGRVEQALTGALAMRPNDRFATPGQFVQALARSAAPGTALGDREVRDLIRRAAELDAAHVTEDGALTIGGVERIAAEAGIPPARVRAAAAELSGPGASVPAEAGVPLPARITAVPLPETSGKIVIEREIDGEVPRDSHEDLVAEIHRVLGFVGSVSMVGSSLQWSGRLPGFVGRDVRVLIARERGKTRVRVEEHIELRGGSIFVPGWGAAAGGLVTLGLVKLLGLPDEAALLAIPAAGGGAITMVSTVINGLARRRKPELKMLADRLAETASRAALPPGSSDR